MHNVTGLIGVLKSLEWAGKTAHWNASGPNFNADHELFGRVYSTAGGSIDALAERAVAEFGADVVNPVEISKVFSVVMGFIQGELQSNPAGTLLFTTRALILVLRDVRDRLEQSAHLSMGFDNLLADIATKNEVSIYLLQQRCGPVTKTAMLNAWAAMGDAGTAEEYFVKNPRFNETQDFALSHAVSNLSDIDANKEAPPAPQDIIAETPGSGPFSTLSRLVVTTDHPVEAGVPEHRDELERADQMLERAAKLLAAK